MDDDLNKLRIALITEVQRLGGFWDVSAEMDSKEAVRYPKDKEKMQQAALSVARADVSKELTDKVIQLINQCWPKKND